MKIGNAEGVRIGVVMAHRRGPGGRREGAASPITIASNTLDTVETPVDVRFPRCR